MVKFFEKLKISLLNGKARQIRILGFHIFTYEEICVSKNKKKISLQFFNIKNRDISNDRQVFYLKVNKWSYYSIKCLQHWIDIINNLNADFFIICDNKDLELDILRKICFKDCNIKFLRSYNNSIVNKLVEPFWINATKAHLTSFEHARKNDVKRFWNIDADDTMFLIKAPEAAKVLSAVAKYTTVHGLNAISLDMWRSRTHGKHWSFGVTFIQGDIDWFKVFNENKNIKWKSNYSIYDKNLNLDWFFTYLKDNNKVLIETFYVENLYFMHYGDFIANPICANICFWKNFTLNNPILSGLYKNKKLGCIPIANDCIKFDFNIDTNAGLDFFKDNVSFINKALPLWLEDYEDVSY